ncbi:hypothetical protein NQZ68_035720 [Dissostichus eleginoides]|nr:hypothetical protein NQZ68_035720 [Dissostichus eleginoides]
MSPGCSRSKTVHDTPPTRRYTTRPLHDTLPTRHAHLTRHYAVGAITGAAVGAITGAVGRAITGAVGRAITGAVVGAITGAVVRAITGAVGGAITGAVVGAITGAVGGAITGAVVVVAGATANVVGSSASSARKTPNSSVHEAGTKTNPLKVEAVRAAVSPTADPATSAPPTAAPESTEAPGSRGPSRTPSRQSSKNEQGSHLEIKPLQKFDSEEPAPDVVVLHLLPLAPSVQERAPSVSENKVESREASRPASRAETTPLPKRQPSPAPSPKRPTTTPEPKPAPTPVEAEAIVAKPAVKVEPKAESIQKAMALSRSPEVPAESLELEGPNTIMICMVILLNIGLAVLFVHILS